MTKVEAVNWIINLRYDIGKAEHRDLWHYEQALSEIKEMLESSDIVSREFVRQIQWERDTAVSQLKDLGYGLGEKIRTDGDTISRQAAIDAVDIGNLHRGIVDALQNIISDLPSAEPEIIRCRECKHAHLTYDGDCKYCDKWLDDDGIPLTLYLDGDFHCGYAKRRTDEQAVSE